MSYDGDRLIEIERNTVMHAEQWQHRHAHSHGEKGPGEDHGGFHAKYPDQALLHWHTVRMTDKGVVVNGHHPIISENHHLTCGGQPYLEVDQLHWSFDHDVETG